MKTTIMKKTLNQEKSRILKLMEQESMNIDDDPINNNGEINYDVLTEFKRKLEELTQDYINIPEVGIHGVIEGMEDILSNLTDSDLQNARLNESNAFIGAAIKARKEGKDKFQMDGKTYKVMLKSKK